MQRQWLLVWESTPAFELAQRSTNPLYILVGGLLFTALLSLLLVVLTVRRTEHIEQMVGERRFIVPSLVFLLLTVGSFALYSRLLDQELEFVRRQVQNDSAEIDSQLRARTAEHVAALSPAWRRAGSRPAARNYDLWRSDAANLLNAYPGLRALQWIDSTYHVRWVEPLAGNEGELERDVLAGDVRVGALRAAAETSRELLTPPMQTPQGYAGFICLSTGAARRPVRRFHRRTILGARPLQWRGRHAACRVTTRFPFSSMGRWSTPTAAATAR